MKKDRLYIQRYLQQFGLFYQSIIGSIAFLPSVLALFFFIISSLLISIPIEFSINKRLFEFITVTDIDASKSIVTTVAGGTISLMVFSFSMVMVVLNEASSNFTPRVLPNLIADRKYQFILGFYAGTILFAFLMILGLGSEKIPRGNLSILSLSSVIFMLINIGLFVFFIHNISRSIQMRSIISRLQKQTLKSLGDHLEIEEQPKTTNWLEIKSPISGHFHGVFIKFVSNHFKKEQHHVLVHPYINQYVRKGDPLYSIKEKVDENELQSLTQSFLLRRQQHDEENTLNRIIQLQEIAVKAMSPGINDPGTMLQIITILEELFINYIEEPKFYKKVNTANKIRMYFRKMPLHKLFERIYNPMITYSIVDDVVLDNITTSLKYLRQQKIGLEDTTVLNTLILKCNKK